MPNDVIYNDTGRAYHYPQPLRTMGHIRGSHADNTLMTRLQQELQTALYYSALDPSLLPVHLQKRRAQLLLEQMPLLDRVARWYGRTGVDIPPQYTICPCHMHTPETWDHLTQCPLAQDGVHLAPRPTISFSPPILPHHAAPRTAPSHIPYNPHKQPPPPAMFCFFPLIQPLLLRAQRLCVYAYTSVTLTCARREKQGEDTKRGMPPPTAVPSLSPPITDLPLGYAASDMIKWSTVLSQGKAWLARHGMVWYAVLIPYHMVRHVARCLLQKRHKLFFTICVFEMASWQRQNNACKKNSRCSEHF